MDDMSFFLVNYNNYFKKKKVRFELCREIIYIPHYSKELYHVLWWSSDDISLFTQSCHNEIRKLTTIYPNMSLRSAQKLLYS